jgi:hypothetical protein
MSLLLKVFFKAGLCCGLSLILLSGFAPVVRAEARVVNCGLIISRFVPPGLLITIATDNIGTREGTVQGAGATWRRRAGRFHTDQVAPAPRTVPMFQAQTPRSAGKRVKRKAVTRQVSRNEAATVRSTAPKIFLPTDYTTFALPVVGANFTDPVFSAAITRLSNGLVQFNDAVHHEYASMSPFNADNTRVLLHTDNSGFFVADLRGRVIVPPTAMEISARAEPRWSVSDPNVFYFHEDNQLRKFELTHRRKIVVHTFRQFNEINFGGGETDISEDGDHIVVIGDERYVGVYRFSAGTFGPTLDTGGRGFDYFDMTPNNNVIVRWGEQGPGRYQGFELFDRNMKFIRQIIPFGAHADRGRDLNGDEILLVLAAPDLQLPPGCETSGIEKVRLSDGKKTCLMGLNWDVGGHISANSNGKNPWALVSLTDERNGTARANAALPPDWQKLWKPYYNELILLRLDGSEIRRIAHHRSRALDNYWHTPRAAISRDGRYVIFDSNFGTAPLPNYTDVFLINLN